MKKQWVLLLFASALQLRAWAEEVPDVLPAGNWDTLPPPSADANDWPWWRGPTLDNVASPDQKPPLNWSEKENFLWKVTPPRWSRASPAGISSS
jgi:hypothetical protein